MARKKKPGRRSGLKVVSDAISPELRREQEESVAGSLDSQELQDLQLEQISVREEEESLQSARKSWADEVDHFQSASQSHWQQFSGGKVLNSDAKLSFTEPLIKEGRKIAHIDLEELKLEEESWKSAVICMVLGANIPAVVFEGFVRRIWGHLGIVQVARMTKGLTMVKFNDEATRDEVLENGMIQFDKKPVIIRPWSANLNLIRLVKSVPLWIRLPNLGLQYWGKKSLSAIVSTLGKPIMVDKHTKDRTQVQFARVLVEIDISDNPDRICWFVNEYGQLVEQEIEYEWLSVKCNHCKGYGHLITDCRKKDKPLDKETGQKAAVITTGNKKTEGQEEGNQEHAAGVEISATIAEEIAATGVDKAAAIAAGNGEKSAALAAETVVAGTAVLAASNAEEGRKKRAIKAPNVAWQAPKHKGSGSIKRAEVEKQRVLRNSFELLGENQREEIGEEGPFFSC
ncbi:uncharacterized protein LOC133039399 [Cannabis sativa]|uniref:uncharacterized protein LOC133039399 n=1 Tax=Cannabis sativa TaxID=3483 RepID=UPI0029C9F4A3|nr:uncharacterized protein LOC133039399 [Cannabis sativa]